MSYRCGIGMGMARLGFEPCDPHILCDGCGMKLYINSPPPVWFLDGKSPRGWKKTGNGADRKDMCPRCKDTEKGGQP